MQYDVSREEKLQEFLTRGVVNIYPNKEFVEARLKADKPARMYLGIDPTGPTLHLGHMICVKKLAELQKLGHKAVLLVGDFTAMIGDPDKQTARKPLTRKEVQANMKRYKEQASTLLDFSGKNKAEIVYNSKWLGKMDFADVLNLASHMTVQQMLERDMFDKRVKAGTPVYIHEFMYPLMQGYDSVAMEIDGEVGGNDQTFNMLTGRTLEKQLLDKEKFVISMKLLEDNTGKKMGKTEGNMVSLLDSPEEMFGKIMSWTDGLILPALELCTDVPLGEIEHIAKNLSSGENPRDTKAFLAREIIKLYHGEEAAREAEDAFERTFQKGEVPDDAPEVSATNAELLIDVLLRSKIVASKSEWRRLVEEGAVTELTVDTKVSDPAYILERAGIFKIGKRRFIKIIFH